MDLYSLIRLLADGQYHTGSELGDILGVTRAAIWKALKRLPDLNLQIISDKHKGYRLDGGLDLLDLNCIEGLLSEKTRATTTINLESSIDSTNRYLIEAKNESSLPFAVCLAEMQTAGRGRRGRDWVSPFGKNIYLSIGFELPGGVESLSGLSLVIGLAVIRTLRELGVEGAMLKWPNDVWIDSRKLAGILVELKGEATTGWYVVVGIGVNVNMTKKEGKGIDQRWTTLSEYHSCARNSIAACLIENLTETLAVFEQEGFEVFREEWLRYDFLKGKEVTYSSGEREGLAQGIDAKGALLISTSDGLVALNAGDVSVRPVKT